VVVAVLVPLQQDPELGIANDQAIPHESIGCSVRAVVPLTEDKSVTDRLFESQPESGQVLNCAPDREEAALGQPSIEVAINLRVA
jgi:hypothetical protein